MKYKEIMTAYSWPLGMAVLAVALLLVCIFVAWPVQNNERMELHKMTCSTIKQSILNGTHGFSLYEEDYAKELAKRCSK